MDLKLAENIKAFRKERKITQEKLAEALGVTVGAVHKWEAGLSVPELSTIVEIADFFDTSVDVLLGYRIRDNGLESSLERLQSLCRTLDPGTIPEAEKILGKYPHSFKAVHSCAAVFLVFGMKYNSKEHLKRSLGLLEQSKLLFSQNKEPGISESSICGTISIVLLLLDKKEQCIEMLKENNVGGIFNCEIGAFLAEYTDRTDEALPYLSDSLIESVCNLNNTIIGFFFLYCRKKDWKAALAVVTWGIGILDGLSKDKAPDTLEKTRAEMLALCAYAQFKLNMAVYLQTLETARSVAVNFDSEPDYSLHSIKFAEEADKAVVFDLFGTSAAESITKMLQIINDPSFAEKWEDLKKHE